jgi:hypothetical protein
MTPEMFRDTFLSNFLADLLVGGGIAIIIQIIFSKNEKRQIEFEERKKKELKAFSFMNGLYLEISSISDTSKSYLMNENSSKSLVLSTSIWDSLLLTGELPIVLDRPIFYKISKFYGMVQEAKRIESLIFETKLFKNDSLREDLESELSSKLQTIQLAKVKKGLLYAIEDSIGLLVGNLDKINKEIRKSNILFIIEDFFEMKISNDINKITPRFKEE